MQIKSNPRAALLTLATCAVLAFTALVQAQAQETKADPTGTWTWSRPGRDGGPARVTTLKLKADADKLTGTLSAPGRGGQARELAIENGKIKGDEISFSITRGQFSQKYNGKVGADAIKGKVEFERNGQVQSMAWVAKRVPEKK